jgi:xyloglucan-specific exo-beta-1,4-glucanase
LHGQSVKVGIMKLLSLLFASASVVQAALKWQNVRMGGGGGFVPGIEFHPNAKGVAYARTDIGGLYRLNPDDSWTPLTDSTATDSTWQDLTTSILLLLG